MIRPSEVKVAALAEKVGIDEAMRQSGWSRESVRRAVRKAKTAAGNRVDACDSTLQKIAERYSPNELANLANGHRPVERPQTPRHDFSGKRITIGVMSDTHLGSVHTDLSRTLEAFREFQRAKVDLVVHVGDVTEGLSSRPGHVYELTHIGYDAQRDYAVEVMSRWDRTPIYLIDGNHDRWFIKSNGAVVVKDVCKEIPNATWLGHDMGEVEIAPGVKVMLWHGEDGASSYALSYRIQKIVESFGGGQKPNILLTGHDHKAGYFFVRNIHCFASGCLQNQSAWMRGKRLAAHVGFWIITADVGDGVSSVGMRFFPYYD